MDAQTIDLIAIGGIVLFGIFTLFFSIIPYTKQLYNYLKKRW
jgi:hypothetical protein